MAAFHEMICSLVYPLPWISPVNTWYLFRKNNCHIPQALLNIASISSWNRWLERELSGGFVVSDRFIRRSVSVALCALPLLNAIRSLLPSLLTRTFHLVSSFFLFLYINPQRFDPYKYFSKVVPPTWNIKANKKASRCPKHGGFMNKREAEWKSNRFFFFLFSFFNSSICTSGRDIVHVR